MKHLAPHLGVDIIERGGTYKTAQGSRGAQLCQPKVPIGNGSSEKAAQTFEVGKLDKNSMYIYIHMCHSHYALFMTPSDDCGIMFRKQKGNFDHHVGEDILEMVLRVSDQSCRAL